MRHAILAGCLAMSLVACGGAASPTGTPQALPTVAPTADPTLAGTATPSSQATPGPTPIAYPGPRVPEGTLTVDLAAVPHSLYDPTSLSVPPGTPFVIAFDNRDVYLSTGFSGGTGGRAHNVTIRLGDILLFNPLPAIRGPSRAEYFLPEGLSAGTYRFSCIVVRQMTGTLTVE